MKGLQQAFVPATRPLARTSAMRTVQRSSHLQIHCRESRAGRVPIVVPKTVKVTIDGQTLKVKGKVEFERTFPEVVTFSMFENPKKAGETVIKFKPINDTREALSMHGLSRALAANMVQGAAEGFTKRMEMVGTGFRASFANNQLTLNCGYSKPRVLDVPAGIKIAVEKQTLIIISGHDKVAVGDFAAKVRFQKPPEPYKGKGIRFEGEKIKLKEGKSAGGKKK